MNNGKIILISIASLVILLSQPLVIIGESNDSYAMGIKRSISGSFDSKKGNDVYLQGTRAVTLVDPKIWSSEKFDVYSTVSSNRWFEKTIKTDKQPSLGDYRGINQNGLYGASGIIQLSNRTNNPFELFYEAIYYDLVPETDSVLQLNQIEQIENIVLLANKYYGFTFNATANEPLALAIKLLSGTTLNIQIITQTNKIFGNSEYFSTKKTEIVPIVPQEDGKHIVFIRPNSDTILSSLQLFNDIPINELSEIESGTHKSKDSTVKFFKYSQNVTSSLGLDDNQNFKVAEINSKVIVDYGSSSSVRIFNVHGSGIFGLSSDSIFPTNTDIFVAVIAEVPYLNEPGQKVADHFDYPEGVKLEYYIIITRYDIPSLPLGEDFTSIPHEYGGNFNYYYYTTSSSSKVMSYNTTGFDDAFFMDPTGMNSYTFEYFDNDLLNFQSDDLAILNGFYVVRLNRLENVRFTDFPIQSGSSWNINSKYKSMQILYVPTSVFTYDMFNITLNSKHNASVSFRFDYYDSTGNHVTSDISNLKHISNITVLNYDVLNNSIEFPSGIYNTNGMYLKVTQTGNSIYNSSIATPDVIKNDDPNLISSLSIKRINRVSYLQNNNPGSEYAQLNLPSGGSYSRLLNNANSTMSFWFDLNLESAGYYYTVTVMNRSITDLDMQVDTNNYFNNLKNFVVNANQSKSFEFGVAKNTHFGMQIDIGPSQGINGTLTITSQKINIEQFPTLDLGSLAMKKMQVEKGKKKGIPFSTAFAWLAIPLIVFIYRKKNDQSVK